MKLLHKLLFYLLLVAIPVALAGIWLFYSLIQAGIQYEVDEQLSSDLLYVSRQLQQNGHTPNQINNPRINIVETGAIVPNTYSDTVGFDLREREIEPIRRLTATVRANNSTVAPRLYRVIIDQPMGEFEEIIGLLSVSITVTFIVLLGLLVFLNGWVARRLWQPFYQLTDQLRQYRLENRSGGTQSGGTQSGETRLNGTQPGMAFRGSDIAEFNQLSEALNAMSRNIYGQFLAQRQFTDNAAHEMQTPLAVTSHELENLLATEPLTSNQIHVIEQAQDSIRRLVRLNKSLLLLTRIENNQFSGESVDVSRLVNELVRMYEDFARHHNVAWQYTISPAVQQTMNPYLAEVLFSNLLQNAVRHSLPGTEVRIMLTPNHFTVENSGSPLPFPAEQLFDRFVKNPAQADSTGLGLALVQQIARLYGMTVRYESEPLATCHTFRVLFPSGTKQDYTTSRKT